MAIDYSLAVIGDSTPERIAHRALPTPIEPSTAIPSALTGDLKAEYGFSISIRPSSGTYVEAESDGGLMARHLEQHISVNFRMDKEADPDWSVPNMLTAVQRILSTGDEEALLLLDHDTLLLERSGDTVTKHNRAGWWRHYPAADAVIEG